MTAQVGILNKTSAVIASDSAASLGNSSKVLNSNDKIFKISHDIPVGIMLNDGAWFCDIPWEKVFTIYSKAISGQRFPKLIDYVNKLFEVIESNDFLTGYNRQFYFFHNWCWGLMDDLISEYRSSLKNKESLIELIPSKLKELEKKPIVMSESDIALVEKSVSDFLEYNASLGVNMEGTFIRDNIEDLKKYFVANFSKNLFGYNHSELIFTGFGEEEYFPVSISIQINAIFNKKVRRGGMQTYKVETYNTATTAPSYLLRYAQIEGASLFIRGISPELERWYQTKIYEMHTDLGKYLISHKALSSMDKEVKDTLTKDLAKFTSRMETEFKKSAGSYQLDNYISPISNMVVHMNVDEMIDLAKTLVNLTSLKQKFSVNKKETVGGPVDVAVLTKENGFEWANKKVHFSKQEENLHE